MPSTPIPRRGALVVCALMAAPPTAHAFDLTVLHTNDVHARLDQENKYGGVCAEDDAAEGKCLGGYARIVSKVAEFHAAGGNLLVLDAGDVFQGTLFYNQYKSAAIHPVVNRVGEVAGEAVGLIGLTTPDSTITSSPGPPCFGAPACLPAGPPASSRPRPRPAAGRQDGGGPAGTDAGAPRSAPKPNLSSLLNGDRAVCRRRAKASLPPWVTVISSWGAAGRSSRVCDHHQGAGAGEHRFHALLQGFRVKGPETLVED